MLRLRELLSLDFYDRDSLDFYDRRTNGNDQ